MSKRLLLTTAVGLILGTAAFAQTSTDPAKKTDTTKSVAQQTEKAKPQSRVEKWQADKQTEAAEKPVDKNTGAAPATSAQTQTQAQTPTPAADSSTTNNSHTTNQAQSNPPASATKTLPNAGAPNAQPQNQQTQTNTPANANQPAANQAQTPNAAPAADSTQQAQQPQNNTTNAASTNNAQTNISAGVSITDPQRTRISESVTKLNVQPVTKVNFSVSIGSTVPRDIRLHAVPADVVTIVPQYRDYKFFLVREEIVIVEPSTMKIVTVLPRNGGATASTTTTTTRTKLSDTDRATVKKNAAQPRRERAATTRIERDDPRSARAESRRELRVGDRVPSSVELYEMPEPAYREAPTLREYRYMSRGSRTYVIEPRERTIIEEID